jgi:7-cyano-7-deazaguanine reductase
MNDDNLSDGLKSLGQSSATIYNYSKPDSALLECFPNPFHPDQQVNPVKAKAGVHIECPEFTSLCPKTGQPDFACIVIDYIPNERCIESKSLKLYLGSYRNHGEFHESCVNRICNDLVMILDPLALRVEGKFSPRGGIPFWPTANYQRPVVEPGSSKNNNGGGTRA